MAFRGKNIKIVLKLGISLVLLLILFRFTDSRVFFQYVSQIGWPMVVGAWVYYSICQWLSAIRWQWLLAAKEIHVPVYKLFEFYMVGMFFNNFLPGAVGGDVVKGYDLYRHTQQADEAIVSVFMERFTGLIGLTLLAIFTLVFVFPQLESSLVSYLVGATTLFLVSICVVIWFTPSLPQWVQLLTNKLPEKAGALVEDSVRALVAYRHHPSLVIKTILLSLLIQGLFALYYAFAAMAMEMEISVIYFLLFLPLITLVTMVPISFGGLGLREAIMIALFGLVGITSAQILALSLSVHVINLGLSLFGGLIWVVRKRVPQSSFGAQ